MITLKNINLSSIDLSGIDLRGIKLGLGGRGGGSGDGFPQLPGDVTRWHFGGLTNEMMAAMDDPRIEDADGKGRFLSFKNFAWGGMSGIGGYVENYNRWTKSAVRADITFTDHSFNVTSVKINQAQFYYQSSGGEQPFTVPSGTVIVKGLTDGQVLEYIYTDIEGRHVFTVKNDGIYTLPSFEFIAKGAYYGFQFNKVQESCNITIEQLPLYPGFILGDGVDDFAVTENNLDLEDTYTIYTPLILLKYGGVVCGKNSDKDFSLNTVISSKSIGFDSANAWSGSIPVDLFEFVLVACKRSPQTMYVKDLVTGKSNQNKSKEFVPNPRKYFVWRNVGGSWCQVAIAGQIICNGYYSTDEDDEKVLDWYKKQYPWLFFDQAWTVVGKTNEDEDRATIANITGNGNDLVLSNFGFAEGSGYNEQGEYEGYLVTDGVDDKIDSSAFKMGEDFTVVGEWKLLPVSNYSYAGIIKTNNLYVYNNASIGISIYVCSSGVRNDMEGLKSLKAICSDGRVYGEDWTEYKLSIGRTKGAQSSLYLGYNSKAYTKMIFKNLGIYNNQILSKDDCIKAYNYLQTLKAK